jgi:hypothetical protein
MEKRKQMKKKLMPLITFLALTLSDAVLTHSSRVSAAPGPDDMLYGCIADPEMMNGFCSHGFLESMTDSLRSRGMITGNEELVKGSIDGKATIVVRGPSGQTRPLAPGDPRPYRENP